MELQKKAAPTHQTGCKASSSLIQTSSQTSDATPTKLETVPQEANHTDEAPVAPQPISPDITVQNNDHSGKENGALGDNIVSAGSEQPPSECKCETIRKDPKVKTKVCSIL